MNSSTRRLVITLASMFALTIVAAPSAALAKDKTVTCKDGTKDEGGQGACSGHGGIDKAATDKEAKAKEKKDKEAAKAATATCKDGSTSRGGQGACSGHGGIDEAASAKAATKPASKEQAEHATRPATQTAEKQAGASRETKAAGEKADPAKGPPTARCKDGTLSYSEHHSGACSNHGGVEEWLDRK